jgi:phospholipase/lecithinase/hemolysin
VGAAAAGGQAGLATAGGLYMTTLADTFYKAIKSGALDKGAQRVLLLNLPPITDTPRFQTVLDSFAAASGGGAAGATARTQSEALFRGWVAAFNTELAKNVAGDARVALFDAAKSIDDVVANPAQYSVTNAKTPACPITGLGSDGLPTYTFPTCTDAALSAAPPAGASGGANWWHSYYFSDSFHPTPYGHQLAYQGIAKVLAEAGWL